MWPSWDDWYFSHEIGTATTAWISSPLYCDKYGSDMVPANRGLFNVAMTESPIIRPMTVCSGIVSDNSGCDICGPGECGPDEWGSEKCSFDMVPDMVSDNPRSDKHCSEKCALTWSDDAGCNKWFPALLRSDRDRVEPTCASEPPWLNYRSNESFILWIQEYIIRLSTLALTSVALTGVALPSVALTSVALTSAALTWSLTRSLTRSPTIPARINMALTSALWHALTSALWDALTIPAAMIMTDKQDSEIGSGSVWLWHSAKCWTGLHASLLRSS